MISFHAVLRKPGKAFRIPVTQEFLKHFHIHWYIERLRSGATGGVRGLIDYRDIERAQLNAGVVAVFAQGYAKYIKKSFPKRRWKIFVGFDTRYHSAAFGEIVTRVLLGNGIVVFRDKNHRATATPITAYMVFPWRLAGSVMITASHNPSNQNGIKTNNIYGGLETDDASEKIFREIMHFWNGGRGKGEIAIGAVGPDIKEVDALQTYFREYVRRFLSRKDLHVIQKAVSQGWRFVVDGLGGVGGATMTYLLRRLLPKARKRGIRVINQTPDPNILGIPFPDPTQPETLRQSGLLATMAKFRADVGVTGDVDWDRFGLVVSISSRDAASARKIGLFVSRVGKTFLVRFLPDQFFSLMAWRRAAQRRRSRRQIYIFMTLASSSIHSSLALRIGAKARYTPVGFKHLGREIALLEKKHPRGIRPIVLSAPEESGGGQFGFLDSQDRFGNLVHKNKDTSIVQFVTMREAAVLFCEGKTIIDAFKEFLAFIGLIPFYERLDLYLPHGLPTGNLATMLRIQKSVSRKADALEETRTASHIAALFQDRLVTLRAQHEFVKDATLFEKVDHRGRILWRRIYRRAGEPSHVEIPGRWKNIPIKAAVYQLRSGRSFRVYHLGEGPRIELMDQSDKLIFWFGIRPSGTEAGLIRVYLEYIERDFTHPRAERLLSYSKPFLEYLGLHIGIRELKRRLEEKYRI